MRGNLELESLVVREEAKYAISNWIIFFTSAFLVFVNFFVSLTVLPQYVIEIGGTDFQSGLQNTLFFLTAVILRFYFGPFADRKGRKIPLLIGAFVFATAPGLFLVSPNVTVLLYARIYQAIGLATFLASGSSLVADLAPQGKTGAYLGFYRMVLTLSLLIGPSAAISVINRAGYGPWFLVSMGIGLLSFGLMLMVKAPDISCEQSGTFTDTVILLKSRDVRSVLAYIALTSVSYGAVLTFAVIYVSQAMIIQNPGVFFVYFGLGGIIANVSIGYLSDLFGRQRLAWPMLMLLGVGTMALFFTSFHAVFMVASSLLTGIGVNGSLLVLIAWLVDVVDKNMRATALSLQESTIDIAVALGALFVGLTSSWFGLAPSFVLVGLIVFLPGLAALIKEN